MPDRPTAAPSRVPLYVAGVCLAIGFLLPLFTSVYVRTDPELGGIPFFFWYQFLLVLITVVLTSISYRLVLRYERVRHAREHQEGEL